VREQQGGRWNKVLDRLAPETELRAFTVSLIVTAISAALISASDRVRRLDWWLLDRGLAVLAPAAADHATLVITRSDAEMRLWGGCVPDSTLARAIDTLLVHRVRAIGVDLYRDTPLCGGGDALAAVANRHANVVFIVDRDSAGKPAVPYALRAARRLASPDLLQDADGVVRRLAIAPANRETLIPLALATLHAGGDASTIAGLRERGAYLPIDSIHGSALPILPLDLVGGDTATLTTLLRGGVDDAMIRNTFVLIGSTATSAGDRLSVSPAHVLTGTMPGVFVHAAHLSALRRAATIRPFGVAFTWSTIVVAILLVSWAFAWSGPLRGLVCLGLCTVGSLVASWALLSGGRWLPIAGTLTSVVIAAAAAATTGLLRERSKSRLLNLLFSSFVTPSLARAAWQSRRTYLTGNTPRAMELPVTVMFVDLRGFTSMAERLGATEVFAEVARYTELITRQVAAHGGLVDDYAGDGVKADFGVPAPRTSNAEIRTDASSAVACARAIVSHVRSVNHARAASMVAPVRMRIGIHSGSAVAGTIGGHGRLKYTVIGDTVNVAARLEAVSLPDDATSDDEVRVVLSSETMALLNEDEAGWLSVGPLTVKGREAPVSAWRLRGVLQ
jgi:adenylate cyclase